DVQQRQESTGQGFEGNRQREIPVQDYRLWGDEEQDRDHYMSAHDRHLSRSDSPYQDQYHARRDSLNQLGFASPRRSPIEVYEPPPQYEELMRLSDFNESRTEESICFPRSITNQARIVPQLIHHRKSLLQHQRFLLSARMRLVQRNGCQRFVEIGQ
ncbi:unnamed protein product, partial [Mesorhabditis belari]